MTPRRRQRLVFVSVIVLGVSIAAVLVISAIDENMLYFFSPSQIHAGEVPQGRNIRVGGLVVDGSVERQSNGVTVHFALTDNARTVTVVYTGILPDLFREGQGIVAIGQLDGQGLLQANEVLAKHDENYMPPDVAEALELAAEGGKMSNPHEAPQ